MTEQFCALATTALNRTTDGAGASSEEATFSACLMHALAGEGAAKVWNEEGDEYVVRWDQMFEFVTTALRGSVGDDRLPRQLGERDVGDPVLARFGPDSFPEINVEVRVHPAGRGDGKRRRARPARAARGEWTAPGPATVTLVPRDYIVVASADGFVPERRRWEVAAYADSVLDVTFVPPQHDRGVHRGPPAIARAHRLPRTGRGVGRQRQPRRRDARWKRWARSSPTSRNRRPRSRG